MKKKILILFAVLFFFNIKAYAFETSLLDMRNRIFDESKKIKLLLTTAQNPLLVNSMWDSCVIATAQLDAYFHMLGIFNTIKKEETSAYAVDFLSSWLNIIKDTNSLTIRSLDTISKNVEEAVKVHTLTLSEYLSDTNARISKELDKIFFLKKSIELKK